MAGVTFELRRDGLIILKRMTVIAGCKLNSLALHTVKILTLQANQRRQLHLLTLGTHRLFLIIFNEEQIMVFLTMNGPGPLFVRSYLSKVLFALLTYNQPTFHIFIMDCILVIAIHALS